MRLRLPVKTFRVLLAVSVVLWMAGGGCMFGCSNTTMAAGKSHRSTTDENTVVAAESCHSVQSHDCCTRRNSTQSHTETAVDNSFTFLATTLPMMLECPLVLNATAANAKANGDLHLDTHITSANSFDLQSDPHFPVTYVATPLQTNRGPTYLRCCVFLI